jgi:hypothetical protein
MAQTQVAELWDVGKPMVELAAAVIPPSAIPMYTYTARIITLSVCVNVK